MQTGYMTYNSHHWSSIGLEGYVMFRNDRMGRRGGGVLLYIKETIPAYEVQLQEEADCKKANCNWSSISLSQHNHTDIRKNT